MTLNSLLEFVREFVGWKENKTPAKFEVLSQNQYRDGLLLRVSRESVTNRPNITQISTMVWIPKDKQKPFLYIFLDSLEGRSIRGLSHRIQILSSDRHLEEGSVKVNIHLSESYWLGNHAQANAIVMKMISYCYSQNYENVDWNWEINQCRKQTLLYNYTDFTQDKARDDYRYSLDRFELRYSAPRELSPVLIEKVAEIINPKPDPPKSRLIEILIIGCVLIVITWLKVGR
jgi:hypothetical protein